MYPTQYWELRASDKNRHKLKRVITLYDARRVLIDCHCSPPYPLSESPLRSLPSLSPSLLRARSTLVYMPVPVLFVTTRARHYEPIQSESYAEKIDLNVICYRNRSRLLGYSKFRANRGIACSVHPLKPSMDRIFVFNCKKMMGTKINSYKSIYENENKFLRLTLDLWDSSF